MKKVIKTLVLSLMLRALSLFVFSNSVCTLLIEYPTLVGITQHVVGVCYVLKSIFCAFRVIWIFVRMVFDGKFLESLLYIIGRSVPSDSHNLVVILAVS